MCQATKSFFFEKFSKMNIDGESFISVMNDNNRNVYEMYCIEVKYFLVFTREFIKSLLLFVKLGKYYIPDSD